LTKIFLENIQEYLFICCGEEASGEEKRRLKEDLMATAKPRILCVDAEPANLKLLEALLVPGEYEVVKARNGMEALAKIMEQRIDVVLLDVMMPEINGFDVCRTIKDSGRYRNIPVILVTDLRSSAARIRGIESGADDFISKPFDQGEILARIRMLLRTRNLKESLTAAYVNIHSLISYGEAIAKHFDPFNFQTISMVDCIANQNIRHSRDAAEKPQIILAGIRSSGNKWQWYRYESTLGKLQRRPLEIDLQQKLLLSERTSRVIFYNENEPRTSECRQLSETLSHADIRVSNMVNYLSGDLCMLALNFGRKVTAHDASVLNSLIVQGLFLTSLSDQMRETESAFAYSVHSLAKASEINDEGMGNHIVRVGEYSSVIAGKLETSEKFVNIIRLQAQVHDIGNLHTKPEILQKPERLTRDEFEEVKKHTLFGAKILGDHVRFTMAREIVLTHHERWDGSGYPYGLRGEQIPLPGRIIAIADQYDSLRNPRAYKPAYDHETACRIIVEGDGRTMPHHFDPRVMSVFMETTSQFEEIYEMMRG
jgi:response regulator RpfG family c-di-GMP phosphodiesterase